MKTILSKVFQTFRQKQILTCQMPAHNVLIWSRTKVGRVGKAGQIQSYRKLNNVSEI